MTEKYGWEAPPTDKEGLLDRAVTTVEGTKRRVKDKLRGSMNAVCLFSIVALEVLHRFVTYGFNAEFAIDYIFSALITSMTSLLAFYVFFPNGKRAGRARSAYRDATDALAAARGALRDNGWIAAFREWCRARSNHEADMVFAVRLEALENLYVTKEDFLRYRLYPWWKRLKLVWNGTISLAAAFQISLCNRAVRRKPYAPTYFLSDVREGREHVYLRGKDHYEARTLALRPVLCVGIGVITSLITWSPKQMESALDVLLSIAISVFQICLASLSGYSSGQTAAAKEELAIRAKAGFIEEFNEAMGKEACIAPPPSATAKNPEAE